MDGPGQCLMLFAGGVLGRFSPLRISPPYNLIISFLSKKCKNLARFL